MDVTSTLSTAVAAAGTSGAVKQAQDFFAAIAGHPGESIGTILGNLGRRRLDNVEAVVNRSHLILLDIGQTGGEVPLNILQPVLEGASLQEDTELQEVWANLLANAADPRKKHVIEPSFPAILKELSWREVRFLDSLFVGVNGISHLELDYMPLKTIYGESVAGTPAGADDFELTLDIVERHRLLIQHPIPPTIDGGDIRNEAMNTRYEPAPVRVSDIETNYSFSRLGYRFVQACRTPEKTT